MMFSERDHYWMQLAFLLAQEAVRQGEVPVGAVLVHDDKLIGQGYNQSITSSDPCAHAEILALRAGAQAMANYRLLNTTLYTTLEPCLMCAGAMVHARIAKLVFAASDFKSGVIHSKEAILDKPFLNHKIVCQSGLMAQECGGLLTQFFKQKRGRCSLDGAQRNPGS